MKSIIHIKKSGNDYKILLDYFLRRSIYFQKQLADFGIEKAGYLIDFGDEFQYTNLDKLSKNDEILLILDNTISTSEFKKISKYLESGNVQVLGCVVDSSNYGDKTILHETTSSQEFIPEWYHKVHGLISQFSIPGYTCFDTQSLQIAYDKLKAKFPHDNLRVKLGNGNNGIDHYVIKNRRDLYLVLKVINNFKELRKSGISIELNLEKTTTYGITRFELNNEVIHTIGKQHFLDGVYIGSELIEPNSNFEKQLTAMCNNAHEILSTHAQKLNRFNVDIIQGNTFSGQKIHGIIDLSLRVGSATFIELDKFLQDKNSGIYQIYAKNRIQKSDILELKKLIYGKDIEISIISKYVITLKYAIEEIKFFNTKNFKSFETNIKVGNYYENPLFRI